MELNDLVNNLIKESKAEQKKAKTKATREKRNPLSPSLWEITALTLVRKHATCLQCHKEFMYPSHIAAEHSHPRLGKRYEPYEGYASVDIAFRHLPKRTITIEEKVPACCDCFDLTTTIESALNHPASAQLSLPFTFYDGKVPVKLGGKQCKGVVYV